MTYKDLLWGEISGVPKKYRQIFDISNMNLKGRQGIICNASSVSKLEELIKWMFFIHKYNPKLPGLYIPSSEISSEILGFEGIVLIRNISSVERFTKDIRAFVSSLENNGSFILLDGDKKILTNVFGESYTEFLYDILMEV